MRDSDTDPSPDEDEETSSATRICFLPSWPSHEKPRIHSAPSPMFALAFAGSCLVAVLSVLIWAVESLVFGNSAALLRIRPALGLASLAALIWLIVRWQQRKKWRSRATVENTSSSDMRIICVDLPPSARPDALLPDVPFEPAIFLAFMTVTPSRKSWLLAWLAMAVALVGQITGLYSGYAPFGPWAAMFAGLAAGELIWPTYFRIVPGRIDALRYSFLTNRPVSVTKTDLSDARIIYDHSKQTLHVHNGDWKAYWIMLVPRRRQFIRALFLAAASTHQPPPLPDDALLG